ncbi:co-chaperone GroES [Reichenbachiella versicolor]|uniref:co-chaperone GroES n=1 Tax=Reichenbachiella versicolor TaxID=1821036 RepID=UPI000D6E6AE9|nr:co-chaperone GroES family protein [Reichenbachiella versicolor]
MELTKDNKLRKLIIVGDRVLIKPEKDAGKTASGIYLPPGVKEKEKIQSGYIVKTGPGYVLPTTTDEDDHWKPEEEKIKYIPLQAEEGDKAIFLLNNAYEIQYQDEKYFIVPQSAILMLERDEDLF